MSIQAVAWALEQPIKDPGAKLLLIALANAHNAGTGQCYPTIERLQHEASMSRRSVFRKLQVLEEWGVISRVPQKNDDGRQLANSYILATIDNTGAQPRTGEGANLAPGEGANPARGRVPVVARGRVPTVAPLKEEIPEEKNTQSETTSPPSYPPAGEKTAGKKGTRLPDEWEVQGYLRTWTRNHAVENLPVREDQALLERMIVSEIDVFRDYWRSRPGQGGLKLDWDATWRNWWRRFVKNEANSRYRPSKVRSPVGESLVDRAKRIAEKVYAEGMD